MMLAAGIVLACFVLYALVATIEGLRAYRRSDIRQPEWFTDQHRRERAAQVKRFQKDWSK